MKRSIELHNEDQIRRKYPLADLLAGWYFRSEEVSAGVWQVEGIDRRGRTVSVSGTDPERLLERAIGDARGIKTQTG